MARFEYAGKSKELVSKIIKGTGLEQYKNRVCTDGEHHEPYDRKIGDSEIYHHKCPTCKLETVLFGKFFKSDSLA